MRAGSTNLVLPPNFHVVARAPTAYSCASRALDERPRDARHASAFAACCVYGSRRTRTLGPPHGVCVWRGALHHCPHSVCAGKCSPPAPACVSKAATNESRGRVHRALSAQSVLLMAGSGVGDQQVQDDDHGGHQCICRGGEIKQNENRKRGRGPT